jgi:hypothetical protein
MGALTTSATASTSWEVGEPLLLAVATGDIDLVADGATNPTANLIFIAAASSAGLLQLHNGVSGAATHNIMVPCWALESGCEYVAKWMYTASDVIIAMDPAVIFVGDTVGLWRDDLAGGTGPNAESLAGVNGDFGVNTGGTGLSITGYLDADGRHANESGATVAERVLFTRDSSV